MTHLCKSNYTLIPTWGYLWHSGGTEISHLYDKGLIPAPHCCLMKITLATCEKNVVKFDCIKDHAFSPGTLDSSCNNTGPETSWENSLVWADGVTQYKHKYLTH